MPNQDNLTFTPEELRPALDHIERQWVHMERYRPHDEGTVAGLPHIYFVPSATTTAGFVYDEIYYWDTFFIAQGFWGTKRQHLVKGLADNLVHLMERFGVIPNSGRLYHTGRSQPPFLTTLIRQVYEVDHDKRWLKHSIDVAKDEYRKVWMGELHPHWRQVFNGLSRYYDVDVIDSLAEAESGWDMTTRFVDRQCLSYVPVDLNALLYKYETDFEEVARLLGDVEEADEWRRRAARRKHTMHKYLWDDEQGFYFDYNFMSGRRSPVWSLAGFFPLWAGMVDNKTAARIMAHLPKFELAGGLTTTTDKPRVRHTIPTQWAYPNGWAPLQLVAVEGMERYGYHLDAERVARRWIRANLVKFEELGVFLEKYNVVKIQDDPVDGLYPLQVGFGWTNGVFLRLVEQYLKPQERPMVVMPAASEAGSEQEAHADRPISL